MIPTTYSAASPALLPVASPRDTARTTLRLLARHRLRLAGTVLVLLAATASALAVPALLGTMVDAVTEGRPWSGLLPPAGAIVAATGTGVALGRWGQLLLARTAQDTLAGLREDVFATAVAQPSSVLEQAGSGDLVSRVAGDAEAVNTVIGKVLPATVSALFTIALTLIGIGIGVIDLRLALAVLAATPVPYLALRRFLARSGPVYRAVRQAEAARGQRIVESLTGADTGIRAAADRLGATAWLDALPEGLGTRVGAGGHDLAAARAQHLALLRLALVAPDVALLDEATAEAGTSDADLLENAAAAALADRTGVVIAHRLSQAARADRTVVMDAGRIVESGTHTELAAAEGPYARLREAWNRAR
ncbi:ABC transporter ATP-binding protein [Streptomyces anulatus]|uniref:ABC transporter ATP-binding protein n=1 Tax=Streptomyces anulatus TaxID=1892 RepID=UPI0033C53906